MLKKILSGPYRFLKDEYIINKEARRIRQYVKHIDSTIKNKSGTVLFNSVCTSSSLHLELFVGYLLAKSGFQCIVLLDDGIFKHWETYFAYQKMKYFTPYQGNEWRQHQQKVEITSLLRAYKHSKLKCIYYSEFIDVEQINSIELDERDRDHAESSVARHFEGIFDLSVEPQKIYYSKCLYNCKVSKMAGKYIVEKISPDIYSASHGIYSTWGPAYDYVKKHNVKVAIMGEHPHVAQKVSITENIMQNLTEDPSWEDFRDKVLDKSKEAEVIRLLDARTKHKDLYWKVFDYSKGQFENFEVEKKEGVKNFGLFPHVAFDGEIKDRNTIFSNMVEWIFQTVKMFENSKHRLIIRFHPGEANVRKVRLGLEDILKNKLPADFNYQNIVFISSNQHVDTYKLIRDKIDIGLLYDGTLIAEMLHLGKPVISCAEGTFGLRSVTIHPKDLDDYARLIINPELVLDRLLVEKEEKLKILYKYVYWYYFENTFHIPILSVDQNTSLDYNNLITKDYDITVNNKMVNRFLSLVGG